MPEISQSSAKLLPEWAQQMYGDFWGIRSDIPQALEAWASALAANQELKEENERLKARLALCEHGFDELDEEPSP